HLRHSERPLTPPHRRGTRRKPPPDEEQHARTVGARGRYAACPLRCAVWLVGNLAPQRLQIDLTGVTVFDKRPIDGSCWRSTCNGSHSGWRYARDRNGGQRYGHLPPATASLHARGSSAGGRADLSLTTFVRAAHGAALSLTTMSVTVARQTLRTLKQNSPP